MRKARGLWIWVAGLWLVGLPLARAQNYAPADVAAARAALKTTAPPKPLQSLPDSLAAYDRLRPLRVAVLLVRNAQANDTVKNTQTLDSYFALTTPSHLAAATPDTVAFRLHDEAVLYVRDLRLALQRYKRSAADLRLYINDVPLPMAPEQVDTIRARNVALVRFRLVRNSTTEPVWQVFYRIYDRLARHNTSFNIGFADGQLGPAYGPVNLLLISRFWLYAGAGLLAMLVGGCWWLINRSNFIRIDNSSLLPFGEGAPAAGGAATLPLGISKLYRQVPFSLTKTQTAFWTLLISGAYLMITVVTTTLPPIPTGLLGLLGISVANGVVSQLLNQAQPDAADVRARLQSNAQPSRGWWADVLTENTGISLARLQFLVFNFIAGVYFVYYVCTRWAFYDFGADVLALISISSAGFLANKNFENNAKDKDIKEATSTGRPYPGPATEAGDPADNPAPNAPAPAAGAGVEAGGPPAPETAAAAAATRPLAAVRAAVARPVPTPAPVPAYDAWRVNLQRFLRAPRRFDDDPTAAIFGRPGPTHNGCTLRVSIAATLRGGLSLDATVQCTRDPLPSGEVVFLLHPTYEQRALTVPLQEGGAYLRFFSIGCFTLIAMLDAGATVLSFDLRDVPGAPSSFLAQ